MAKQTLDRQQVGDLVVETGSENYNNRKPEIGDKVTPLCKLVVVKPSHAVLHLVVVLLFTPTCLFCNGYINITCKDKHF